MQTFEDHLWTLLLLYAGSMFQITSTSHGQIHVWCLHFKTVIFIVVADLEISVSVCLYYYVWELWFGYRCYTRVRKQEAMELNTCEGLEIAE